MDIAVEHVDELDDHWWWRPGWRSARHFYACHLTMEDQPELRELITAYQDALARVPGLDLIPAQWLHLTLQGIGFTDEIHPDQVEKVRASGSRRLAAVPAPTVTFHRPVVRPEAVYLPAEPAHAIRAVREAVREAITDTFGPSWLTDADELRNYRPHVSVAYSNTSQPAQPILDALAGVVVEPVSITLSHVDLLEYHRDRRMYEWTSRQEMAIGSGRR